jgi:hypothetical protein
MAKINNTTPLPPLTPHEDLINALASMQNVGANKSNSHFKSKYVTLDALLDSVKATLIKHNLALIQTLISDDGKVGIQTSLLHVTGHSFDFGKLMVKADGMNPQQVGGALTYLRRQSICTALTISVDTDHDGNDTAKVSQAKWHSIIPESQRLAAHEYCVAKGWLAINETLDHLPAQVVNAIMAKPDNFLKAINQ